MTKSISEILAVAKDPAYVRVEVARIPLVPQSLIDEHVELDAELQRMRKTRDTVDIPVEQIELAERVAEIEREIDASVVEFRFKSIGSRAWQDLVKAHPPTKEQIAATRDLPWNFETFPYEAMAQSAVEPPMTVDDVRELENVVNMTAWNDLFGACLKVNVTGATNPKSAAAGSILRRNGGSATTAANSESRAASSSAA